MDTANNQPIQKRVPSLDEMQFGEGVVCLCNHPADETGRAWQKMLLQLRNVLSATDVAVFEMIDGAWKIVSRATDAKTPINLRVDFVAYAVESRQVLFHNTTSTTADVGEFRSRLIASPIVIRSATDTDNLAEPTRVLYAWRDENAPSFHESNQEVRGFSHFDASFTELVADKIAIMERQKVLETELAEQADLLQQAFPAKVIERLKTDHDLLDGCDRSVTTMFVDLVGFSSLSNQLETDLTFELIADLMDGWTNLVVENLGIVVDYFGDGLVAFWNAPLQVENHASMAIQCAKAIRNSLSHYNKVWQPLIDQPLDVGIGIATGMSRVGNCGSRRRIKYGPHGPYVNLAARIEKLTRHVGVPVLISCQTAEQAVADFLTRRICKARVRGFDAAVDLFEAIDEESVEAMELLHQYDDVLLRFESDQLHEASGLATELVKQWPQDRASQNLAEAVDAAIKAKSENGSASHSAKITYLQLHEATQK